MNYFRSECARYFIYFLFIFFQGLDKSPPKPAAVENVVVVLKEAPNATDIAGQRMDSYRFSMANLEGKRAELLEMGSNVPTVNFGRLPNSFYLVLFGLGPCCKPAVMGQKSAVFGCAVQLGLLSLISAVHKCCTAQYYGIIVEPKS